MMTPAELRKNAREQLKNNWGLAVLVGLIYLAINVITSLEETISFFSFLILTGPLTAGLTLVYLKLSRSESSQVQELFDGFKRFVDFFVLNIVSTVFILLWSLLLIVPGIIAAIRYSQAYFLMIDDPNLKPLDAIKQSSRMMDGYKGKYVVLILSFIGWILLSVITLFIGFIFLVPYMTVTFANFYNQLKTIRASEQENSPLT
jgi:uncharacterized membrane protein